MRPPISPRATTFVRQRATAVMQYTCRIERVTKPSYDTTSLVGSSGSRTTIYTGVCRLWEVSVGAAISVAGDDITIQNTNLSIPWDTGVLPKRNDEVLILSAVSDPHVVGKRYQIESSAKAGEMRATRRFMVTAMERT